MRSLLSCLLLLALTSCLSMNFVRTRFGEPVADASIAKMESGPQDLTSCLAELGAPELVWTSEDGNMRMAYAWSDVFDWGFSVTFSFNQFVQISGALDSVDHRVHSVVLAFDEDLQLVDISRGYLWDLAPSAQASNPAFRLLNNTPR